MALKFEGSVLWVERGSSQFGNDPCYFIAVAITNNGKSPRKFSDLENAYKVILKGNDAKQALSSFVESGLRAKKNHALITDETVYDYSVYYPSKMVGFYFTGHGTPETTKKPEQSEHKFTSYSDWGVFPWPKSKDTNSETPF